MDMAPCPKAVVAQDINYCSLSPTSCSSVFFFVLQTVPLQSKLDDYQVRKNNGERLNHDQLVGTNTVIILKRTQQCSSTVLHNS